MSWYVLYKDSAVNAFERFEDRKTALSTAFAMVHRGHEVIELGRIGGSAADALSSAEIKRLMAEQSAQR
jgi:predicted Fe-Mo cluster-binding NifX family protein